MTGAHWRPFAVLVTGNVFFGSGLYFHSLLYNFYLDALGFDEGTMGLAQAALVSGGLVALIPAGRLIDRFGGRGVYGAAAVVCGGGLAATALVTRPIAILTASFLAGLGTTAWRVAMAPLILDLAPVAYRSRAFSWNVAALVGSGALWMWLAGVLPEWVAAADRLSGLRAALVMGAGGTVLALFAGLRLRETARWRAPDGRSEPIGSVQGLERRFGVAVGAVALWMLGPALVLPFFNIYFERAFALSLGHVGGIFALSQVLVGIVIVAGGEAAHRVGTHRMLTSWTLLFAPALWLLAAVETLGVAVAVYAFQAVISPATNPLIDELLLRGAPAARRGAVSSWRNAATEVSGIVGAALGGRLLAGTSFVWLFVVAGGVGGVGAVAMRSALLRLRGDPLSSARHGSSAKRPPGR